jgi:hypothetical protein
MLKPNSGFCPLDLSSVLCPLASGFWLRLCRSRYRANICASTAVNAFFSIDHVFAVALGDSVVGAAVSASAAGDTVVVDLICHCEHLILKI